MFPKSVTDTNVNFMSKEGTAFISSYTNISVLESSPDVPKVRHQSQEIAWNRNWGEVVANPTLTTRQFLL